MLKNPIMDPYSMELNSDRDLSTEPYEILEQWFSARSTPRGTQRSARDYVNSSRSVSLNLGVARWVWAVTSTGPELRSGKQVNCLGLNTTGSPRKLSDMLQRQGSGFSPERWGFGFILLKEV